MGSPLAFRDAFAYVYSRRGCVTPYESFLRQLGELEPILKANADIEKADVGGTVVERYIVFSSHAHRGHQLLARDTKTTHQSLTRSTSYMKHLICTGQFVKLALLPKIGEKSIYWTKPHLETKGQLVRYYWDKTN